MSDPRSPGPEEADRSLPGPGGLDPREVVPTTVVEPVRCLAHTTSGAACRKWAIVGGYVCATHGGSAPQVRAAANRRILALAPRAVQVLGEVMEQTENAAARVRAATELLDRGVGKAVDVTLDITPQDPSVASPLDARIRAALDARGLGQGGQAEDDIIDAEVIETGADQGVYGPPEP